MNSSSPPESARSDAFEIAFDHYDPEDEKRRESLLALGNGVLFSRTCATEPRQNEHHYPGFYQAGCYETLTGRIEGRPAAIESLVNLPNWLPLTFRIEEGPWFALDDVKIEAYRHALDLAGGVVRRIVRFRDATGRRMRLTETRLVSMADPRLVALRLELTPMGWSGEVEILAGLDGAVTNAAVAPHDGYDGQAFTVQTVDHLDPDILLLSARTRRSSIVIGLAARMRINGQPVAPRHVERAATGIEARFRLEVEDGRKLVMEKVAGLATSLDEADPVGAAVQTVRQQGEFAALEADHRMTWDALWRGCRLELERQDLSRTLPFHAFTLLQTVSPHSVSRDAGLPSRGWQEAYHGQIFWDETLSFPFLNLRFPEIARGLLLYRHRRLDAARDAAARLGLGGAMFPWRSAATGQEVTPAFQRNDVSGAWMPDHTYLQRHVGAAIAWNVWHHVLATGDEDFLANQGGDLLVEIARFWTSLAQFDEGTGRYGICGVVGPDEFHTAYPGAQAPGLCNSGYTNVMAAWSLLRAGDALALLPATERESLERRLKMDPDEPARWADVARRLHLPVRDDGTISQFDGFDRLSELDLEALQRSHPDQPVNHVLDARGDDVNAYRVLKQADMAMLLHLMPLTELTALLERMGYPTIPEQLRRTIDDDYRHTVHDSSLSNLVYAGAYARFDPGLSWRLYESELHPDAKAGHSGSELGLHLGAMAATLDILQRIYLGIEPQWDALSINPAPPPDLGAISLDILYRSARLSVNLSADGLSVQSDRGNAAAVQVEHAGRVQAIAPGAHLNLGRTKHSA